MVCVVFLALWCCVVLCCVEFVLWCFFDFPSSDVVMAKKIEKKI